MICIKLRIAKPFKMDQTMMEATMPIESVLVTVFVLAVFTGFAVVLAWAEYRSRNV